MERADTLHKVTSTITVYVNGKAVSVLPDDTVADAVTRCAPDLGDSVRNGTAYVTDGVGRRVELDRKVVLGAIFRVV